MPQREQPQQHGMLWLFLHRNRPIGRHGGNHMSITVNLYYTGKNGAARRFAEEMAASGTVDAIRQEKGNLQYDDFFPM